MMTAIIITTFILLSGFASVLALAMCKAAGDADRQIEKERQDWLYPKS